MNRAGIALPLVLLLLLALGAAAMSTLVVARTELLLERGNLRYLERRIRGESALEAPLGDDGVELPAGAVLLSGGFVLRRAPEEIGPRPHAVTFLILPDSIATWLPGALEVGASPPTGGVSRGPVACDSPGGAWQPLVRVRPAEVPANPPVPAPPRIGPLGIADLLRLGAVHAPAGARIEGGSGAGVLVGSGDLALGGDARFRGLVVLAGDLEVGDDATLEGVALVGGRATVTSSGRIIGCRVAAAEGMRATLPRGLHAVPGGGLLGAF